MLLVDFINDMGFEGAEPLRASAARAADVVVRMRMRADALKMPAIYVNDNFGRWRSEFPMIVDDYSHEGTPTFEIVRKLKPRPQDYVVVKPHLSGFYSTSLPVLLPTLGVSRLVITGVAVDICVMFKAADAHMRNYDLWVPSDAVGGENDERAGWALDIMKTSMAAEIRPTSELTVDDWFAGPKNKKVLKAA